MTDIDGKFVLSNIPSNAKKIQISYVGMKPQEVSIKPNLIIVLESDSEMIDEAVVGSRWSYYGECDRSQR